ncbi:MAG TPA: sulfite exporter TauE/SafE family protein [bacterium]|nr:sulfite exporter TauE/SafE family protein [bacterium]
MIAISLVVGLSAAAAAATGFGFNLVSAPLLTFVYPPRLVVVLTLLLGVCASGMLLLRPEIRREVEWSVIRPLFLSSLAGMPIGVALLLWGRPQTLRAAIAALTAAFAIAMLTRFRPRLRGTLLDTIAVGVLSGLLSTSTSLNGPPVALYLVARRLSMARFRGNMVVYVFLATVTSLVLLALGGTINTSTLALAAKLLPAMALGFVAGIALVGRMSERGFETMILGFLALVGLLGVSSALR